MSDTNIAAPSYALTFTVSHACRVDIHAAEGLGEDKHSYTMETKAKMKF